MTANAAAGPDGTIYFLSQGCRLYALYPDGQLRWFLPLPSNIIEIPPSSVAITPDGKIVVGDPYRSLYEVNPDGSLAWVSDFSAPYGGGGFDTIQPVIDSAGEIYVGTVDGEVNSVGPDGSHGWYDTTPNFLVRSTPALAADGTLYLGLSSYDNTDGLICAYRTNGSLLASNDLGAAILSSPVILPDGSIVVTAENGNVYCLWGTGAPLDTNAPWPMFQHDQAHTGQAPTNGASAGGCGAPFVFNGDYNGGHFYFSMTGKPADSNWNVYASTNLAQTNWSQVATGITLDGMGNAYFTNDVADGVEEEFYVVSRSNCTSKAIGFVNLTVNPGLSLIANQTYQVDDGILIHSDFLPMNTLAALFGISNSWGSAQSLAIISKWNGTGFDSVTNVGLSFPSWSGSGLFAGARGEDITMVPGTSVFISHTNDTFPIIFNGLLREEQVFQIQASTNRPSTNFLSATVPEAGYITNITGYRPLNGDTIMVWTNAVSAYGSYPFVSNMWTNGTPYLHVGDGFVLVTTNAHTWTNTWQPSP